MKTHKLLANETHMLPSYKTHNYKDQYKVSHRIAIYKQNLNHLFELIGLSEYKVNRS
jgi:hypothetical protein